MAGFFSTLSCVYSCFPPRGAFICSKKQREKTRSSLKIRTAFAFQEGKFRMVFWKEGSVVITSSHISHTHTLFLTPPRCFLWKMWRSLGHKVPLMIPLLYYTKHGFLAPEKVSPFGRPLFCPEYHWLMLTLMARTSLCKMSFFSFFSAGWESITRGMVHARQALQHWAKACLWWLHRSVQRQHLRAFGTMKISEH